MAAFKAHCRVGFWKGALLKIGAEGQGAQAVGPMANFASLADMPDERTLIRMVEGSGGAERRRRQGDAGGEGAEAAARRRPPYMLAAIKKNKKARGRLGRLQPVAPARIRRMDHRARSPTRRATGASTPPWNGSRKASGRNWKYER